ncbi:MAG: 4'-phosphopantetheinyl transferase superfamily protein, partial [Synergistaceae bacterium]|nr:4'-phosphopantetheinyl transferase superfamily protein [Synergistaceae bacterium]
MILGIGVDLCSISRIEKAIESEHFVTRIFSPEEIEYSNKKGKRRCESFAASFAAREAFCKASGISL